MAYTLISTDTISSAVASVAISGTIDNTYDIYEIHVGNLQFTTSCSKLVIEFSDNTTNYNLATTQTVYRGAHYLGDTWTHQTPVGGAGAQSTHNSSVADTVQSDVGMVITEAVGVYNVTSNFLGLDESKNTANGIIRLYDPSNTTFHKKYESDFECANYQRGAFYVKAAGSINTTSAVEKIRFATSIHTDCSSPKLQAGIFRLYGVT